MKITSSYLNYFLCNNTESWIIEYMETKLNFW